MHFGTKNTGPSPFGGVEFTEALYIFFSLEPPAGARNRRKASVKIRRNQSRHQTDQVPKTYYKMNKEEEGGGVGSYDPAIVSRDYT